MADADSGPEEAITKEEIQGEMPRPKAAPRNAFTELMAAKPKAQAPSLGGGGGGSSSSSNPFKDRMGLGAYLADPASFPASRVIYFNADFVAINDKFPKATIHALLLPRSAQHNLRHPLDAFQDATFLAAVRAETAKLRSLVAKELQRRLGAESASDAARQAVLNGEAEPAGDDLPAGRDWEAEVRCGVHAVPSMSHLHVHVFSRDMHSACLKHRKHYNSFNTRFLVAMDELPLAKDDARRDTKHQGYLKQDFQCWRCGRNFGNQFKRLKEHLDDEFRQWKRE